MSLSQFNRWLASHGITKGPRCYRVPCTASIAEEDPSRLRVTITTRARDRHGDILEPGGARISNYLKNPVVLWAHEYRALPVGRTVSLMRDGDALKAEVVFADTRFAREVRELYAQRFLRAWSVGFLPLEWDVIEDAEGKFDGYHVRAWELIELSAVPVPANPEALTDALANGMVREPRLAHSLREAASQEKESSRSRRSDTASEAEAAPEAGRGQPGASRSPETFPPELVQALAVRLLVNLRPRLGEVVRREIRRRQGRLD